MRLRDAAVKLFDVPVSAQEKVIVRRTRDSV